MLEMKLLMMGIPKSEINSMSSSEIQILLQVLAYMNEGKGKKEP